MSDETRAQPAFAAAVALALALTLGGCAVYDPDETPEPPVVIPASYHNGRPAEAAIDAPDRWWKAFGDPRLDHLIERLLNGNLDLRQAWHRIEQASAVAEGAASRYWPQVTADASIGGSRSVFNLGGPIGLVSNESANYRATIGASYEVDLWRKIATAERAAELDALATRQDYEALAMTLTARVTEVWLAIIAERELLDLLTVQEETSQTFADLIEARFGQGFAAGAEVYQQRQLVASIKAQRPLIEARVQVLEHQLAALLGVPPGPPLAGERRTLPAPPPPPDQGVPAALLTRRPDVEAARLRVAAFDNRVAAAVADQYPALSLSASTGFQAPDLAEFLDSWIWNLAANLTAPLFDGGRRAAEVDRQQAIVREQLHRYAQVWLNAVVEVEDALVQEARYAEHLVLLDEQLALSRQSLDEQRVRYVNGLNSYLDVLTALRTAQQAEQTQLASRRQLLTYRVQLYRALGGRWTQDLDAPSPSAPPQGETPEEVAP